MAAPRELFDFYVAEGIDHVCFNVEESKGDHVSQSFADSDLETAYFRFLGEFWRLSAAAPGKISFVREIETALHQVIRPEEAPFRNQLVEPFAITSMDCAGNIATFSPELLGLKNPTYNDFVLGNVNHDNLADLLDSPVLARMLTDINTGVAMCRDQCEYFSVCGGGEPVNKLAENGSFASTETAYCRVTKMRATDLILDTLDRVPTGDDARDVLAYAEVLGGGQTETAGGNPSTIDSEDSMRNAWRWLGVLALTVAAQGGFAGLVMAQGTPAASPPASAAAASEGYQGGNLEESVGPHRPRPNPELNFLCFMSPVSK